jgi:hypothetical protein
LSNYNLKIGATAQKLTAQFVGWDFVANPASAAWLRYAVGALVYERPMTSLLADTWFYQFTPTDFAVLTTGSIPCTFKVTTGVGDLFWPDPGTDFIIVEKPMVPT